MIRTILFDMGGTLDGEVHWLDRFTALYKSFGVDLPWDSIRNAFDAAECKCSLDESIASSNLTEMVNRHVQWQLEHLDLRDPNLARHLTEGFTQSVRKTVAENVNLLAMLVKGGFELGVVSNGCGNVQLLCQDFGYTPFLSVIVDSGRVGLFKPDPAIFLYAAHKLRLDPEKILMVGDSFDRDVKPAKTIGMKTAWLEGIPPRSCPDPRLVDIRLKRVADLPATLSAASLNIA